MADPDATPPASRKEEIERLRARLHKIRAVWGTRTRFPPEAQRLEDLIVDRRIAAAALQYRIEAARLAAEDLATAMRALTAEIGGYEAGLEAILRKVLEDATGWSKPMWSPIPVFGYRLWWVTPEGLQGATRFVWRLPHLSARCGRLAGTDDGEVPHTDGRCGRPPCGIYALKDPATLVRFAVPTSIDGPGVVIGLTALSGKVVEHDEGYRARHARVLAAAVLHPGRIVIGSDPDWIASLFNDPIAATTIRPSIGKGPGAYAKVVEFLIERQHREEQTWILGNRSA